VRPLAAAVSALTHLAAVRLMERELLALECGSCGHEARHHSLHSDACRPLRGKPCRCRRWEDPDSLLLAALDRRAAS